jgi:hypothetical protein
VEIDICEYIPYGRKNAVSRAELQRHTGLPDRTVRTLIEAARRSGAHILSSSADKGYWQSDRPEEIREFIRESDSRIRKTAQAVEPLRRYIAQQEGGCVVPVRAHFRRLKKPPLPEGQITF